MRNTEEEKHVIKDNEETFETLEIYKTNPQINLFGGDFGYYICINKKIDSWEINLSNLFIIVSNNTWNSPVNLAEPLWSFYYINNKGCDVMMSNCQTKYIEWDSRGTWSRVRKTAEFRLWRSYDITKWLNGKYRT